MSIIKETRQIIFPWDGDLEKLHDVESISLRDLDIVGLGTRRRHQIEKLQEKKNILFLTHKAQIPQEAQFNYQEELLRTLQWLRPQQTREGIQVDLKLEHKKTFSQIFPRTEQLLGVLANRVRDSYIDELSWSSWMLQDYWRYFVGFIRQRFPQNKSLFELAHWEWAHVWIDSLEYDLKKKSFEESDESWMELNPTLQILALSSDQPTINQEKGLYAIAYSPRQKRLVEKKLDVFSALLIDFLQEDQKFTFDQLIELAESSDMSKDLPKKDRIIKRQASEENEVQAAWRKILEAMVNDEIITTPSLFDKLETFNNFT
jgi:hypothetical protein